MATWTDLFVADDIISALDEAAFTEPTPIQTQVLPVAIRNRSDILGAAPTIEAAKVDDDSPEQLSEPPTDNLPPSPSEATTTTTTLPTATLKIKKPKMDKCKKKSKSSTKDYFQNMAFVEELDMDTGEVKAVHSLLDNVPGDDEEIAESVVDGEEDEPAVVEQKQMPIPSRTAPASGVHGLVLVPTRELAFQVCRHLRFLAKHMTPRPRIDTIVGGIAPQKQLRILSYRPDVLVATPGRLWHFIQEEEPHVCTIRDTKVLVVDEADRLIEANHFEDLRLLFDWLNMEEPNKNGEVAIPKEEKVGKKRGGKRARPQRTRRPDRQTMVFSATLTFVHRGAVKRTGKGKRQDRMTKAMKLDNLRYMLGLSPRARIFDLSSTIPDQVLNSSDTQIQPVVAPTGLQELRLLCPDQASKDIRLFWFLAFARHRSMKIEATTPPPPPPPTTTTTPPPSPTITPTVTTTTTRNQRCLIFLNSKAGVRRLLGVLRQLSAAQAFIVSGNPPLQHVSVLHADMVQKQRLRNLERFQADPYGVLIASDVAARGLDLASAEGSMHDGVSWVVHFECPRTTEVYIHRRGRTARAHRTGCSVIFLCPKEMNMWRRLAGNLTQHDLPDFPTTPSHFQLVACERIVQLAKQLDLAEHSASRRAANEDWFSLAAKDADIELDSDLDIDRSEVDGETKKSDKRRKARQQFVSMRATLKQLVLDCKQSLRKKTLHSGSGEDSVVTKWSARKQLKRLSKQEAKPFKVEN